ncbi:MAG: ABC transporter ATP-binding protein [Acidimicrobiia bacterium]|nr:ABC transporter ATP-binding protein [Acidimicrobiia bacterium]
MTLAPPRTATAASIANGVKVYGSGDSAVHALDDVSVEFDRARFTAIMGPSGSGKSTLLHTLAGLDSLTSGTVHIGDTELGSLSDRQLTMLRRQAVGFIFQSFNLIPTLNAEENIKLPLSIAGEAVDEDWFDAIVATVGLKDRLDHRPTELSGGQQQRVAAARALVSRPDIIFADEPSGNLDSTSGAELLSFMRQAVREFDQTIVMVTHDPVAAGYADRVVFLADGTVVDEMFEPTPERVLDRMKTLGG